MGRPAKIKTPTAPATTGATTAPGSPKPKPKKGAASLQAAVDAAAAEIERIHREEDPGQLATNLKLAGVKQRYWDLRSLLVNDPNEQLACARSAQAEAEQQVRAAKSLQVDLLRELFVKAEAMERHSSALKGLK